MKAKCTEGSMHGDKVSITFYIPEQKEVDAGACPEIAVDVLELLVEEESNGVEGTAGLFIVDALSLFMDEAHDAESAETVAQWLEIMANDVRAKFPPARDG